MRVNRGSRRGAAQKPDGSGTRLPTGAGEANAVGGASSSDPDALSGVEDRLGPPGSSSNPDVTGTKDVLEE